MKKIFQNKTFLKPIQIFLVCLMTWAEGLILFVALPANSAYFKYDKDIKLVFTQGTEFLLRIAGGLALFVLVLGGVYYIVSGANPDGQNKAKKVITYAVMGLAIVLVSYVIIVAVENIAV